MPKMNKLNEAVDHNDYFIGQLRIFSDVNVSGTRTRTTYDSAGNIGARRVDAVDGRSLSDFEGPTHETYRVSRERGSITVLKKDENKWIPVKDRDECARILKREREVFTPPNFAMRVHL
jgi:YD repeat-containing protein